MGVPCGVLHKATVPVAILIALLLGGWPTGVLGQHVSGPRWEQGSQLPSFGPFLDRCCSAAATGHDGQIYILGGGDTSGSGAIATALLGKGSWALLPPFPTPLFDAAMAVGADGQVYLFGGVTGTTVRGTVAAYNPRTGRWTLKTPLLAPRTGSTAVLGPDGRIYLIGGALYQEGANPTVAVDAYDPRTNTWTHGASLPDQFAVNTAALGPDGRIYAAGVSSTDPKAPVTVEAYNVGTNTWTPAAPLPEAGVCCMALTSGLDGRLYAIGGGTAQGSVPVSTVFSYTPRMNRWAAVSSLRIARAGLVATTGLDGTIYAAGGHAASMQLETIEIYHPTTRLLRCLPLPLCRSWTTH